MKNLMILSIAFAFILTACKTTDRSRTEDDLTEEKVIEQFENEKSGNKVIYTGVEDDKDVDLRTGLDENKDEDNPAILYSSLADRLRKIGGLRLEGTGDNIRIILRGGSSLLYSNEPIFVLNGVNIGRGYRNANNAVDVNQIASIRILRGPSQTALYGEEGKNGVIIMKTKNH